MANGDAMVLQHWDDLDGSLTCDPGFEYPTDGSGTNPIAWTIENAGTYSNPPTFSRDSTEFYQGSYSQKISVPSNAGTNGASLIHQDIDLPLGDRHLGAIFTPSVYFKLSKALTTDVNIFIWIGSYKNDGTKLEEVSTQAVLTGDTNWHALAGDPLTISDVGDGLLDKINVHARVTCNASNTDVNVFFDYCRCYQSLTFPVNPRITNIGAGVYGENNLTTADGYLHINNLVGRFNKRRFDLNWRFITKEFMQQLESIYSFRDRKLKFIPYLDALAYLNNGLAVKWIDKEFDWDFESANIGAGYRVNATFEEVI